MKQTYRRLSALLMALCLCLGLLPHASAAGRTVTVETVQDLEALSQNCTLDTYSQGLTVALNADLDLTGSGFRPIPIFCGTFQGNGHTVRGFRWEAKGSDQGLFRTLAPSAVVRDLRVADSILSPEGSRSGLGLLCGRNEGTIENCQAAGIVSGDADVGGLVGVNAETGVIRACVNRATVTGTTHTGGIAGRNEGTIDASSNRGSVNPEAGDKAEDTGGVAGLSTGSITGCQNYAALGYKHTGYNVGGIVGRQSGNVVGCENHGPVLGRKDVGGIVGQFEPYTTLHYGEDKVERVDDELSKLSGLLTRFADQVNDMTGAAVDDLKAISDAMGVIRGTAYQAGSDGMDDAQSALDQVYQSNQTIQASVDSLLTHWETFAATADRDAGELSAAAGQLRDALDEGYDAISGALSSAEDSLDFQIGNVQDQVDRVSKALEGISRDIQKLETCVKEIGDALDGGGGLLEKLSAVSDAVDKVKGIDMGSALQDISKALGAMNGDLEALWHDLDLAYENVDEAAGDTKDRLKTACDRLSAAGDSLGDAAKRFSDAVTGDLRAVNDAVGDISGVTKAWLDAAGATGSGAVDGVDRQLQTIGDRVDQLTGGAASYNSGLHDTTGDIIDQLDVVRSALTGLTDAPEKTVDDVSDAAEQEGDRGRVISCANDGAVEADTNVGGIAGTVAPELSLDPEDDLDVDADKLFVDTTAYVKATLRDCRNTGAVTARNDCVGGVVGRADVGAVLDCTGAGAVESTSGGQAGGVVGLSYSVVRRSYALCTLTGGDKVGGIAGEGHEIRDCRAMVTIDAQGEQLGAIAGTVDGEAVLTGNLFVREDWAAVDGVDYAGKAEAMDYEDFKALPGLPQLFLGFTVTFSAEGRTVAEFSVPYGGSIPENDLPQVPARESAYGAWEDFDPTNITRSRTVEAVYSPWVSTISSGEDRPVLLAQGAFTPSSAVLLTEWTPQSVPKGYELIRAYSYELTQPGAAPYTLRVLAGEGAQLALLEGGALVVQKDARRDGGYLVLETDSPTGSFAVVEKPPFWNGATIAVFCILAAAVLALGALLRKKKKKPVKV